MSTGSAAGGMEIAQSEEGLKLEGCMPAGRGRKAIAQGDGVVLPAGEKFFGEADAANVVVPNRRIAQLKATQILPPVGLKAGGELTDGKFVMGLMIVEDQCFADARKAHDPTDRRQGGSDQQAVILARVATDNG